MNRLPLIQAPPAAALTPLAIDVVSVQSQVVYGRVGNNVALPAMTAHGMNVAAVPTVILGNTPHYPSMHGGAVPSDWFAGYLDDLVARGALAKLKAILVGYMGNPEQMAILARWIARVKVMRPEVLVVVDPVIGDHDVGIHVAPGMVDAWRDHLLPLADGLAPNGFELACLAGVTPLTVEQTVTQARSLLTGPSQWIVVTSAAPGACPAGRIQIVAVTRERQWIIQHQRIDASPKGTGDLFSAELTAFLLAGQSLPAAVLAAHDRVAAALECTRHARSAELLLPAT